MPWTYLEFKKNQLWMEDGTLYIKDKFESGTQAEQHLIENDLRATITKESN